MQYYLNKSINTVYKKLITRFRISAHSLKIETDRKFNVDRCNRLCIKCDQFATEDEFHFILVCSFYTYLRKKVIKQYYYYLNKVFNKLIKLISVNNVEELCNIGKVLYHACEKARCKLI